MVFGSQKHIRHATQYPLPSWDIAAKVFRGSRVRGEERSLGAQELTTGRTYQGRHCPRIIHRVGHDRMEPGLYGPSWKR